MPSCAEGSEVKNQKKVCVLIGLSVALYGCALQAQVPKQRVVASSKPCVGYLPELTLRGSLNADEQVVVVQWTTTCTSAFSASSVGVNLSVQQRIDGQWRERTSGLSSYIPSLNPGVYRIVAKNIFGRRVDYSVTHRRGLG
jgi:hypothetical protein